MDKKAYFIGYTTAPTAEEIQTLADEILDELPDELTRRTRGLEVVVEEFPDDFIMSQLELESPYDAFGVYQSAGPTAIGHLGKNLNSKDKLYLYRRPILDAWCETGDDLTRLINRVVLQEIGYHFGYSEDQIDMYEETLAGTGTGTYVLGND